MPVPDPQTGTFLTREEVAELTGARTRRRQIEVLQNNGLRHVINAAGWPVVPRSAIDTPAAVSSPAEEWSPAVLSR